MSTDSDKILTRYTNAETVVTSSAMNKVFGGEFGYNDSVDEFDPLVAGHVHDGLHADGHASKILLTDGAHVRGYLSGSNLGGTDGTVPAVQYKNIKCYSDSLYGSPAQRRADAAAGGYELEILAIPEFVEDPVTGERCYYLDLSNSAGGIDGSVQFNESGSFSGNNDFVYDYSNMSLGIGTEIPTNKLHVTDLLRPPLKVEGITSGTGTPLVVHSDGTIYSDSTVGNQDIFQSVDLSDNSSSGGSGQHIGDSTITADSSADSLNLVAGDNIIITGDAATDSITIEADSSNPGGPHFSIQFNDGNPNPAFAGTEALLFNNIPGGQGPLNGPAVYLTNMTPGPVGSSDPNLYNRFSFLEFTGFTSVGQVPVAGVHAFHHTYGATPPPLPDNSGMLSLLTTSNTRGPISALLIDGGQTSLDGIGYVGIGATDPDEPLTSAGFKTPARRLHVLERLDPPPPQGYSPIRVNDLYDGVGSIVLWNGPTQTPVSGFPNEGDLYKLSPGNEGDHLVLDALGNPAWHSFSQSSNMLFSSQWFDASNWTQKTGSLGSFAPVVKQYAPVGAGKDISLRVLVDDSATFYLTTSVPVNGELSGGVGSGAPGSHPSSLSAYIDASPSSADLPTSCRITLYFMLNGVNSGTQISNLKIRLHYPSNTAPPTGGLMASASDGDLLYKDSWNQNHFSSNNVLENTHSYSGTLTQNGMLVVSDFSGLKISPDQINAGLYSFKATFDTGPYDPGNYWSQEGGNSELVLVGSRVLWIWDSEEAAPEGQENAQQNSPPQSNLALKVDGQTIPDGSVVDSGTTILLDASGTFDSDGDVIAYSWEYEYDGSTTTLSTLSSNSQLSFDTTGLDGPIIFSVTPFDGISYGQKVFSNVNLSLNNAPQITLVGPSSMVINEGDQYSEPGYSATDQEEGSLTNQVQVAYFDVGGEFATPVGSIDSSVDTLYLITYNVVDSGGLAAPTVSRTVAINAAPVISLLGDNPQNISKGSAYSELGATASDSEDGDISNDIVITNPVNTSLEGTYNVEYQVQDQLGLSSIVSRVVNVINDAPIAIASGDSVGLTGQPVNLDGSGSSDPNGDPLSYIWSFQSKPATSALEFSDIPNTVTTSFTPDVDGSYVVKLKVNDGSLDSIVDTHSVSVSIPNQAPTAVITGDSAATVGQPVNLDGSGSSDPDGDPLSYIWSFQSKPATSALEASDIPNTVTTSFTPDVDGSYIVKLKVNDGSLDSIVDTHSVSVSIPNQAPTAVITGDSAVIVGQPVNLDGSGSSDPDGDPLSYIWSFQSKPATSALEASDIPNTVTTSFTPDVAGSYIVKLKVNDGSLDSVIDTHSVSVSENQTPLPKVAIWSWDPSSTSAPAVSLWPELQINLTEQVIVNNPNITNFPQNPSPGHAIAFYGARSIDQEDTLGAADSADANIDLAYNWEIVEAPPNSTYAPLVGQVNPPASSNPLVDYDLINTKFTIRTDGQNADNFGHYTIKMTIEDSLGSTASFLARFKIAG